MKINSKTKYNDPSLKTYKEGDKVYIMPLKDVIERSNEIPGVDVYTDEHNLFVDITISDPKTGKIIGNRMVIQRSRYDNYFAGKKTRVLEIDNGDPYIPIKLASRGMGVWLHPVFLN